MRKALESFLGPNYRRLLFASCEFGGVDCNEPMLSRSDKPEMKQIAREKTVFGNNVMPAMSASHD